MSCSIKFHNIIKAEVNFCMQILGYKLKVAVGNVAVAIQLVRSYKANNKKLAGPSFASNYAYSC